MATIYLARHAQSEMNINAPHLVCGRSETTPLTEHGIEQAKKLGKWIGRNITEDLSLVASSPAWRAYDTIAIALEGTRFESQPIRMDGRLHEMSQGEAEGVERTKVYNDEILHRLDTDLTYALPGAESQEQVSARMLELVHDAVDEFGDDATILAGTHGMAIRCLAGRIRGLNAHETRRLKVDNASINTLTLSNGKRPAISLNTSTQW